MFIPGQIPLLKLLGYFPRLAALSLDYNLIGPLGDPIDHRSGGGGGGGGSTRNESGGGERETIRSGVAAGQSQVAGNELGAFLSSMPQLLIVSLNRNPLRTFDNVLLNTSKLKYLSLSKAELRSIPFPLPPSLVVLVLSDNDIRTIPRGALQGLSSLQLLILSGNKITLIAPGAFEGLRSVRRINLGGNRLTALSNGTFDGLGSLQQLSLASNRFQRPLERRLFRDLVNLSALDVSSCSLDSFDPRIIPSPALMHHL